MTRPQLAEKYGISIRTVSRYCYIPPATMGPKPRRKLKPCGTDAAYRRHKYRGEYPCVKCLAAHARQSKKYSNGARNKTNSVKASR